MKYFTTYQLSSENIEIYKEYEHLFSAKHKDDLKKCIELLQSRKDILYCHVQMEGNEKMLEKFAKENRSVLANITVENFKIPIDINSFTKSKSKRTPSKRSSKYLRVRTTRRPTSRRRSIF